MPYFESDRVRLHFEDHGQGDPLVILPGVGGDHRAYAMTARQLSRRRRVVILDPRDAGRSQRSDDGYTTDDLARDLREWSAWLGLERFDLFGHSLGGLIAQVVAVESPELVRTLILCSTHPGATPWRRAVLQSWITMRSHLDPKAFTEAVLPWLVAPSYFATNPEQIDGLIRFAEKSPDPQDAAAYTRQARAALEHRDDRDLAAITARTLVLSGRDDLVNPPEVANELAGRIPGAELRLLDGVGHLPHVEAGPRFRAALEEFLDATGKAPS